MLFLLIDAEIGGLEQLLDQDDVRSRGCSFTNQCLRPVYIRFNIPTTGHLRAGNGHFHIQAPGLYSKLKLSRLLIFVNRLGSRRCALPQD
jgi:hypothetical protein